MAKPQTVVELLAELPEEQLKRMRDVNRQELGRAQAEVARLSVETQQIEQAISKRQRDGAKSGRLTAQQVLNIVEPGMEVTVADVVRYLSEEGYNTTPNAVRNHLTRLVEREQLIRVGDRYTVPRGPSVDDSSSSPSDDDFPF